MKILLLTSCLLLGIGAAAPAFEQQASAQMSRLATYRFRLMDRQGRTATVRVQARDSAEALLMVKKQFPTYKIVAGPARE